VRDATRVLGNAVLLDGDRILEVGQAERLGSPDHVEVVYPGATIVPGMIDAHLHPIGYAASLSRPVLKEARDFDDVADILREAAHRQTAGSAMVALRLDDEILAEGRLPDRRFLDRVLPDRPALVIRYCGHVAVANSAALALAGIDGTTPDPPRGSIDRDDQGSPTGVLRETAVEPVAAALGSIAPAVTVDHMVEASNALAAMGLTSIGAIVDHEAGCWAGAGSELDLLIDAADRVTIGMEVFVIAQTPADLESAAQRLAGTGGRVRFAGLKMFSDGSLGGHTAAMHQGFADDPDQRGTDRLDPAWAKTMAAAALSLGGRVAVHAIGDLANERVLDLMQLLIDGGADPARLRVEHASVLAESDIHRFGSLGVTASVQPAFIASETEWLEKRLGPERLQRTYPFRSLAEAGTPLAGGSDSPVETPDPLWGIAAARDRCGIVPAERLDAAAALALFTSGAAAATGAASSFDPGTPGHMTVLSGDPVETSPDAVRSLQVLATWVEGSKVEIPSGTISWKG
jgi:predicted amidohydrolase YtcJ